MNYELCWPVATLVGTSVCAIHRSLIGGVVGVDRIDRLSCQKSAGCIRSARHNALNELIKRALLKAHIPAPSQSAAQ